MARHEPVPHLRPAPIFDALRRHGVHYVAVGSYPAIVQGVDLEMTDLDIVPARDSENRRRLAAALEELGAREMMGDTEETIEELNADPESIFDRSFRTFVTRFGGLDVVLQPAGFRRGYEDLVGRVAIAVVRDETDPTITVEAVLADKRDVYESKRRAGRPKDVRALPAFLGVHPADPKGELRSSYQADILRRRAKVPPQEPPVGFALEDLISGAREGTPTVRPPDTAADPLGGGVGAGGVCGAWMPIARANCALPRGHAGHHRSTR